MSKPQGLVRPEGLGNLKETESPHSKVDMFQEYLYSAKNFLITYCLFSLLVQRSGFDSRRYQIF
jgi:hypothetical protein